MKERAKHKQAFLAYLKMGPSRSLPRVAEQFGCTARAVENWSVAFGWKEKIAEKEKEARAAVQEEIDQTLAEVKSNYRAMVAGILNNMIKKKKEYEYDSEGNVIGENIVEFIDLEPKNVKDVETLIKLDLHLLDAPDLRVDVSGKLNKDVENIYENMTPTERQKALESLRAVNDLIG